MHIPFILTTTFLLLLPQFRPTTAHIATLCSFLSTECSQKALNCTPCLSTNVTFVCHDRTATRIKRNPTNLEYCVTCKCGTTNVIDPVKCSNFRSLLNNSTVVNSDPPPRTAPKSNSPLSPSINDPSIPIDSSSLRPPPSKPSSSIIGGGIAGTLGGIIFLVSLTTFYIHRQRRFGSLRGEGSKENLTHPVDFTVDVDGGEEEKKAEEMTTSSSIPALAVLARSNSTPRIKPGDLAFPIPLTHPLPQSSLSPSPSSPSGEPTNPLYTRHIREREQMRSHWRLQSEQTPPTSTFPPPTKITTTTKPHTPSPLRQPSISTLSTTTTSSTQSQNTYKILSPYTPTRGDEIPVSTHDTVVIWRVWEDGWCFGSVVEKEGSGEQREGVFPLRCIRLGEEELGDVEVSTVCGWEGERGESLGKVEGDA